MKRQNFFEENSNNYLINHHSIKNNISENLHFQDNYSSTSVKEESSKNYEENHYKHSSPLPAFDSFNKEIAYYNLENKNQLFQESNPNSLAHLNNNQENILLGKKVKIQQIILENSHERHDQEFSKKRNEKKEKNTNDNAETKNRIKKNKKTYSVFQLNKKIFNEQQHLHDSININSNRKKENKKTLKPENEKSLTLEEEANEQNQSKNVEDSSSFELKDDLRAYSSESSIDENELNAYDSEFSQMENSNSGKRVSAISKVNFTKLSEGEKEERLKNLAVLVKKLRRKVRNLENRFKSNANKILKKYISNNLGIKKHKSNQEPLDLDIDNLCKALKCVRQYEKFDYNDQKHVIENFIKLIAEEKISLDSINFTKICTQIRIFLSKESSKYIANKGQKITFSFPEKDINITAKEYELYSKYKDREDIIRTIVGIPEEAVQNSYPERIHFEPRKNFTAENNPQISKSNNNDANLNLNNFNPNNLKNLININNSHLKNEILKCQNPPSSQSISSQSPLGNQNIFEMLINNGTTPIMNQQIPNFTGFSSSSVCNPTNATSINNKNTNSNNKLFDQLKNFQMNGNFNINYLNNNNNPASNSNPTNLHNLLINSMYSNLLQNFSLGQK